MKKKILTALATLFVFGCALSGCGSNDSSSKKEPEIETPEKPDNNDDNKDPIVPDKGDENKDPVIPDVPGQPAEATITDFNKVITYSRPTSTQTNIEYTIGDPYDVTLHHSSILNVEYGSVVKGEYVYSHETLNPIGSQEMISTHSGINYVKGNLVGELTGTGIDWNASAEQEVSFLKISLQQGNALFETNPTITDNSLSGKIKDSKLKPFGITQDITNLNINLEVTNDFTYVTKFVLEYDEKVSSDPLNPTAHVLITANYTYNPVTVTFPENM